MRKMIFLCFTALMLVSLGLSAQAPKRFLDQVPPSPKTKVVTIKYENSFDGTPAEALLELPPSMGQPVPLIVTPNAAGWTQEMNRSAWSGVADRFNVMILYPRGQGTPNPNVTIGSPKQMANLESAMAAVEKKYKVDEKRVYAAGVSQGAIESLLLVGRDPERFAGALSINPIVDFIALYDDYYAFLAHPPQDTLDPLTKLRIAQWAALEKLFQMDMGGTPDTARAAYYQRSPVIYAQQISRVPLILYWAEDDELISDGAHHQGGMFADLLRTFHPVHFQEVKHTGGHGYPFYQINLAEMSVNVFPREIFLDSVKPLLQYRGDGAAAR